MIDLFRLFPFAKIYDSIGILFKLKYLTNVKDCYRLECTFDKYD
jgi:hypothetical protein